MKIKITKKIKALIAILLVGFIYTTVLLITSSPMTINMTSVVKRNIDIYEESQGILITSRINLPISTGGNNIEVTYLLEMLYNKNNNSALVTFSPENGMPGNELRAEFDGEILKLYVSFYGAVEESLLVETKADMLITDDFFKSILTTLTGDSKSQLSKECIDVVEKNKRIKRWGYTLKREFSPELVNVMLLNLIESVEVDDIDTSEYEHLLEETFLESPLVVSVSCKQDKLIENISVFIDFKSDVSSLVVDNKLGNVNFDSIKVDMRIEYIMEALDNFDFIN